MTASSSSSAASWACPKLPRELAWNGHEPSWEGRRIDAQGAHDEREVRLRRGGTHRAQQGRLRTCPALRAHCSAAWLPNSGSFRPWAYEGLAKDDGLHNGDVVLTPVRPVDHTPLAYYFRGGGGRSAWPQRWLLARTAN